MFSSANVPELRLQRMNKLIQRFMTPPNLLLSNLFGEDRWDSERIKWEGEQGDRGMTPFAVEDAPSPATSGQGVSDHEARAAFWKEKEFLSATQINNLREPGNEATYYTAQKQFARMMMKLEIRNKRRKEWMHAQMLSNNGFTYLNNAGERIAINYGVPIANRITLLPARFWGTAGANIVQDFFDMKLLAENQGIELDHVLITTELLQLMVMDATIQTLLAKSNFGNGDLFARPMPVLAALLGLPQNGFISYNEMFQVKAYLTGALPAGAGPHTFTVDDTRDFAVGDVGRVWRPRQRTWETLTITVINHAAGAITAVGLLNNAYVAQEDFFTVTKKFLPTNTVCMFASKIDGQKTAEFALAPFSLERQWGVYVDKKDVWDPDGTYVRCQNKGLPILYFEDAIFTLQVN
jgi:hypothetical protein